MSDPRSPNTISGLVGWYTGLSAEVTSGSVSSWKDISGQGNHATTIRGSPSVETSSTPTLDLQVGTYYDDFSVDTSTQYIINTFVSRGSGAGWVWDTANNRLLSDISNDDIGLRVKPGVFMNQKFKTLDVTVDYDGTSDNDGCGVIMYDGTIGRTWISKISNEYTGNKPEIMYTDSLSSGSYVKVATGTTNISVTQPHILRMTYDYGSRQITFYVDSVQILSYTHTDLINIETFGIVSLGCSPETIWDSISASYTLINNRRFPALYGTTADGLTFPTTVMTTTSNHTLFHVARYYKPSGAPSRGRIFNGATLNWLSGFHSNRSGVAYHGDSPNGGWVTPITDLHGNQWVLSTDQRNMYRSNGTDRTSSGYSNGASDQLTINTRYEYSDWAVAEVIIFNRELTSTEYLAVEAYLSVKYFNYGRVPATGVLSGSLLNAILYTKNIGGYPLSIPNYGPLFGTAYGTELRVSDLRGLTLPDGSSKELAVPSANFLLTYGIRSLNGIYWIKPDGFAGEAFQVYCDLTGDESGIGSGGWMRVEYAADLYTQANPWTLQSGFAYSGDFTFTHTNNQINAMKAIASEIRQTLDSYGKGSVGWTYNNGNYMGCKTLDGSVFNSTSNPGINLPSNTDYSFSGWNSSGVITPRGTDSTDANDQTWRQGLIYLVESGNTYLPILGIYNRDVDATNEERYFPLVSGDETSIWIK